MADSLDAAALAPNRTALSKRMHALADTGHPRAAELREKADAFDAATTAHYDPKHTPETAKRMLGAFARARRLWCDITGEPLV